MGGKVGLFVERKGSKFESRAKDLVNLLSGLSWVKDVAKKEEEDGMLLEIKVSVPAEELSVYADKLFALVKKIYRRGTSIYVWWSKPELVQARMTNYFKK